MKIIKGKTAKKLLDELYDGFDNALKVNPKNAIDFKYAPLGKGLFKDGRVYVAFDNSTGDLWVEEFNSKKKAKKWLKAA